MDIFVSILGVLFWYILYLGFPCFFVIYFSIVEYKKAYKEKTEKLRELCKYVDSEYYSYCEKTWNKTKHYPEDKRLRAFFKNKQILEKAKIKKKEVLGL